MMTPAKPATDDTIDPALVARMVELVKQIAEYGGTMVNLTEARSIVSDLPDEEDPIHVEALAIAEKHMVNDGDQILFDSWQFAAMKDCIRRGIEMAGEKA